MLGGKIKSFLHDLVNDGDSEIEIYMIEEELDQLIESHKRCEELKKENKQLINQLHAIALEMDQVRNFNRG
jgi:DNA polymerase III delta prime subunit